MARLGSMASLAGNDHMLALLFHIDNIGVAGFTNVVASKGHGSRRDFSNGRTTIMTVLAKAVRHDSRTQNDEGYQGNRHNRGEPNEMFYVLEQVFLSFATLQGPICAHNCAMIFDTQECDGEQ